MARYNIVVVDDEVSNLESLERILRSDGAKVHTFQDPKEALVQVRNLSVDVLITDLRMETLSGMELLEALKLQEPGIEVVLVTAYGTVELAVEAMKKGAYDFITKPLQRLSVLRTVHKALEKRKLVTENQSLKEALNSHGRRLIVGNSEAGNQMMETARQAAQSRATVLIEGESGTGKGVLADYLHHHSEFSKGVFVNIDCTSIPENLLEAELFGYEQGAFTGATRRKKGRVELARGGTLFLDEIGIASPTLQAKLLRFLQEGAFERLGGIETHKVDTRFICATNTNLKEAVKAGKMREDLYYRLNVINIKVPPLRSRKDDIPLLAKQFIEGAARKNKRPVPLLRDDAIECLMGYGWPGNIRELENLMESRVVLNQTGEITPEELPPEFGRKQRSRSVVVPIGLSLKRVERLLMDETLRSTRGDKKLAAKLLGVHPRTIYRHLESLATDGGQGDVPREESAKTPSI